MARVCQVTGKGPMVGHNVSHANNKTRRRFLPNLQQRRFWVESENRWVSLRLTNNALRTIDKNGIDAVLADQFMHQRRLDAPAQARLAQVERRDGAADDGSAHSATRGFDFR